MINDSLRIGNVQAPTKKASLFVVAAKAFTRSRVDQMWLGAHHAIYGNADRVGTNDALSG